MFILIFLENERKIRGKAMIPENRERATCKILTIKEPRPFQLPSFVNQKSEMFSLRLLFFGLFYPSM